VRAAEILAAARDAGARIDLVTTGSLEELAAAVGAADGRRVLLVGGDGSIHAVANLREPPGELALLPAGGANNVARSLGIPLDARRAARLAVSGWIKPVDLIEATTPTRRYVTVESVSVGFLAQARARYRGANSVDVLEGLRAGAAALERFHPLGVRVTSGCDVENLALAQLFVANLPLYEFGLHVAPQADATDGLLDFVGVEAGGRAGVGLMLGRLLRGTRLDRPGVHVWRARHGRIATHGASPIVADSEDLGFGPVELAVLPGALPLVRP
jgi:diacylglycerol kinase (ATP)